MKYLQEQNIGFSTPFAKVPIVPAAVIFDLGMGQVAAPRAEHGYLAAQQASTKTVVSGRIGAGRGASCGKYLGFERAQHGGLGSAAISIDGCIVAALAVVNAFGDVVDQQGQVIAGARRKDGSRPDQRRIKDLFAVAQAGQNTTLVVVATNATVGKAQAHALAQSAHIGIAHSIRPSHTVVDGDTSFVISTCQSTALSLMTLSVTVQRVVAEAVRQAVLTSNTIPKHD
jgi:L-aminopeptidase/D-esterase-like protein